jgi:serine/threonine-protein kinase
MLHRTVALKLLHPLLAATARGRERFRREARLQAQLTHPGIVAVHACDELRLADGRHVAWFAMPYVPGVSLAERLRREGALPAAEVRRILLALLDALAYAHADGVVHRDLKPENILLEQGTGRVLLTDFGVAARPSHDDPRAGAADVGTPLYMAPEQFAGEHAVDGRTDLYALGAVAYLLLAGQAPFAGVSARALAVARFSGAATPLAPLVPGAPPALVAAIERCLAADRAARWPSARDLADALVRIGTPRWRQAVADVGGWLRRLRTPRQTPAWRARTAV